MHDYHWTHGNQPYIKNNKDCANKLNEWIEKSKTSQFYLNAIDTWTIRDVNKLHVAQKNNLNYFIIYNENDLNKLCELLEYPEKDNQ